MNNLTTETFIKKAKIKFPTFDYSKVVYKTTRTEVCIICPNHGEFYISPHSFLQNKLGCPKCSFEKRNNQLLLSQTEFIEKLMENFSQYDHSKVVYKNYFSPITLICKTHGEFEVIPNNLFCSKHGCKKCALIEKNKKLSKMNSMTKEEFIKKALEIHNNKYDYSDIEYEKCHQIVKNIICPQHGKFDTFGNNHLSKKSGCWKCSCNNKTKPHMLVEDFLKESNISFVSPDRTILDGSEIDILIPEKNFGIEINGLFWHNENNKPKSYHLNKTKLCEEKNIHLIHIWDHEINNKFDIIKGRIKSYLGLNNISYAKEYEIKEISNIESKRFQIENHLQGPINSLINLALIKNNIIYSIMTFGKPRFGNNYEYELLRLCTKQGESIIGGNERLFSFFKSKYNPTSIISFADRRFTTIKKNIYLKMGFLLDHISDPNYFYYKNNSNILSRYNCQKHKLKRILNNYNPDLSETINMKNNGFIRVYDCGNLVYIWTKK